MMNVLVSLVGAGPGSLDLVTVGAVKRLQTADVVVYDYLSNASLLAYARENAETIFVGKKGFTAHVTQDQINDLLVQKARSLKDGIDGRPARIVRLKGGDPFVFGRGGEEALVLAEAGIPFEVVPGVTSGIAAPAFAGIPVTHRKVSSSVAFITGNEDPTKEETAIDWDALAHGADTLCFYMGIRNLPRITQALVDAGRDAATPVALVRWGTTSHQQTLVGTLANIAQRAADAHFAAPAIIVVGNVVELREHLHWFESQPLLGTAIAVTRTREQAGTLSELLRAAGADVVECPTIRIERDTRPFDAEEMSWVHSADWAVFTSANGVTAFFDRLYASGADSRSLQCKIAAIGTSTAQSLKERGVIADLVPREYRAETLADDLIANGVKEQSRVLIARAAQAREVLPRALERVGAEVRIMPVYRTVASDTLVTRQAMERILDGEVVGVTLTSSSTATNFADLVRRAIDEQWVKGFEGTPEDVIGRLDFYSIGPITTETAHNLGMRVVAEPQNYTVPHLVDAIIETVSKQED